MIRKLPCHLRGFARDVRAGATIELALGAVVLVLIAATCFDLYSRIKSDTAGARLASVMADYVSRDAEPDGDGLKTLGEFLYRNDLRVPANLVYAITAFQRPTGDPQGAVKVLWSDNSIRFGDETVTESLADGCTRFVGDDGTSGLPGEFDMAGGEVLIVVEVCARLTREGSLTGRFVSGDIYRLHAVPAREPTTPPSRPTYSQQAGVRSTSSTSGV